MHKIIRRGCLAVLLVAFQPVSALAEQPVKDETAIRQVLMSTWNKPESPLTVEPVVIEAGYALAGWTQDARGGRALLARQPDGRWTVRVCGGDSMLDVKSLEQSALPPATAKVLAAAAVQAEAKLPAARRALFSTFGAPRNMTGDSHEDKTKLHHH